METSIGVSSNVDFSGPGSTMKPDHVEVELDNSNEKEELKNQLEEEASDLSDDIDIHAVQSISTDYWQGEGIAGEIREDFMKTMRLATRFGVEAHVVEVPSTDNDFDSRLFNYLVKAARNHSPDRAQLWFVPDYRIEDQANETYNYAAKTLIQKFGVGAELSDGFFDWYDMKSDLFKNQVSFVERFRYAKIGSETPFENETVIDLVSNIINLDHRIRSITFDDIESWQNRDELLDSVRSDTAPSEDEEEAAEA